MAGCEEVIHTGQRLLAFFLRRYDFRHTQASARWPFSEPYINPFYSLT